jgi:ribonuclease HII
LSLIAGVDDAGRGPIIGPLIIAGVLFREGDIPRLLELGVKDSKALTPARREVLKPKILDLAIMHRVLEFSPAEIDRYVLEGRRLRRLNWLEAKAMAQVIESLRPDVAYVDASDVDASRFGAQIRDLLSFKVQLFSDHHADQKYPVVAAASIVAKVHRDRAVAELHRKFGDFGSGYPGDPRTIRFLEDWIRSHHTLPEFVRRSWKTVVRLKCGEQTSL